MRKVKVKSLYMGQVGIHEKYLERGLMEGLELHFIGFGENKGRMMTLTPEEVTQGSRGKDVFLDKFNNNKPYHLVYFNWKPDPIRQTTLL